MTFARTQGPHWGPLGTGPRGRRGVGSPAKREGRAWGCAPRSRKRPAHPPGPSWPPATHWSAGGCLEKGAHNTRKSGCSPVWPGAARCARWSLPPRQLRPLCAARAQAPASLPARPGGLLLARGQEGRFSWEPSGFTTPGAPSPVTPSPSALALMANGFQTDGMAPGLTPQAGGRGRRERRPRP